MILSSVRRFWQNRFHFSTLLLACFCIIGLIPESYGQADNVNELISRLKDPDYVVRSQAAAALGKLGAPPVDNLIAALKDNEPNFRNGAAEALGEIKDPRAVEPLIDTLEDSNVLVRASAAEALGRIKAPRAVAPLIAALKDTSGLVQMTAAEALGEIKDPSAVEPLIAIMKGTNSMVSGRAAEALGKLGAPAVAPLIALLKDTGSSSNALSDAIRYNRQMAAANALGEIKDPSAVEPLIVALGDAFFNLRVSAANALGEIKDPRAVGPLVAAMKDPDLRVRKAAAAALGEIGLPAVGPLVGALKDTSPDVRQSAAEALGRIKDPQAVEAINTALKDADPHSQQIAAQGSTFTYLVPKYLAAAATLDLSTTRPFLSANYPGDLVTEIQALQRSGWMYSAENSTAMIRSETLDAGNGEALVTVEIAFEGGSGVGVQWDSGAKTALQQVGGISAEVKLEGFTVFTAGNSTFLRAPHTFHLVWENGAWKIARIDPAPRMAGPSFKPW
jgi:HEAT repeat protein